MAPPNRLYAHMMHQHVSIASCSRWCYTIGVAGAPWVCSCVRQGDCGLCQRQPSRVRYATLKDAARRNAQRTPSPAQTWRTTFLSACQSETPLSFCKIHPTRPIMPLVAAEPDDSHNLGSLVTEFGHTSHLAALFVKRQRPTTISGIPLSIPAAVSLIRQGIHDAHACYTLGTMCGTVLEHCVSKEPRLTQC